MDEENHLYQSLNSGRRILFMSGTPRIYELEDEGIDFFVMILNLATFVIICHLKKPSRKNMLLIIEFGFHPLVKRI